MCNCIQMSNEALKPKGMMLSLALIMQSNTIESRLYIPTVEIGPHKRGFRPAKILVTYCPFCGEKQPESETDTNIPAEGESHAALSETPSEAQSDSLPGA